MIKFNSLVDFLKAAIHLDWDGAVFVDMKGWNKYPRNIEVYVLEGYDELEDL